MRKVYLLVLLLSLCATYTAGAVATDGEFADCSGIWKGRCMFSKVEAHVRQEGNKIQGVALVHTITGEVNPYHFKGEIRDGKIHAAHHSGHRFSGELVSQNEVVGILTTAKKGYELKLQASRVSHTPTKE